MFYVFIALREARQIAYCLADFTMWAKYDLESTSERTEKNIIKLACDG